MRSSFEGMEGMEGRAGAVAPGPAGGGSSFFPDRIDLPFVSLTQPRGRTGTPHPISKNLCSVATFPNNVWTAEWYGWLVLTEFVENNRWAKFKLLPDWAKAERGTDEPDWASARAKDIVDAELDDLIRSARDERPDALGEILAQSGEFVSYFLNLLSIPESRPNTARLLRIANFVAGFCAMYYKGKYIRPRPSMICPALLPPVPVPGHASFPSGHSTQAHLVALCIKDLLANRRDLHPVHEDLTALADRIARNREIAGLHYPSDTEAGIHLAAGIHDLLRSLNTTGKWYRAAFEAAVREWEL